MKNIKFIKEPGYIYDLFFLFVLYFNKEYCITNFINYDKSAEDTKYFDKILMDFAPFSDELMLFFYLKENSKSFITQFCYKPYREQFATSYNFGSVQNALSNYSNVIDNILYYYFEEINEENIEKYRSSVYEINRLIKKSKYNGELKSSLYSFFIEPIPVIQKLLYELTEKNFLLSKRYEESFQKIMIYQNNFDFNNFNSKIKRCRNCTIDIDLFDDVYISPCLITKGAANIFFYDDKAVEIIGVDSDSQLDYLIAKNDLPTLDAFGNIISEKNRIKILDLILRKGEIVIKDVEQELGFTGTNAYYHINMMIRANMVQARNQGRVVFYNINDNYFDSIFEILSKYKKN